MPDDALFHPLPDGSLLPGGLAVGPWDRGLLHGGPVAALLAGAAEGAEPDGAARRLARLTVELTRPVPVAPLRLSAAVLRSGRTVRRVAVTLTNLNGVEVASALALLLRRDPELAPPGPDVALDPSGTSAPDAAADCPPEFPAAPVPLATFTGGAEWPWPGFHAGGMEIRLARGGFGEIGPAAAWFRLTVPVLPGETPSPAQRAVAASDFGNGIASALPFEQWRYLNPDLSVHLSRDPVGDWVCLDSRTRLGDDGGAIADSALFDRTGAVGRAVQTLLLERR